MDPKEAVKELRRRQKDPNLIKKVNDFLKGDIPEPLKDFLNKPPIAVLFRNIFTPDYELDIFLKKVSDIKGEPILFEYVDDIFVAKNEDKYALGKLMFYLNTDRFGQVNMFGLKIIDFNFSECKQIKDLKTTWGESLVDFHHRMLDFFLHKRTTQIYNFSDWLHRNGACSKKYYKIFFALFIVHSILFENFRTVGPEADFYNSTFIEAFNLIKEYFGISPIICRIQSQEEENNQKWWGYPKERMGKFVKESHCVKL